MDVGSEVVGGMFGNEYVICKDEIRNCLDYLVVCKNGREASLSRGRFRVGGISELAGFPDWRGSWMGGVGGLFGFAVASYFAKGLISSAVASLYKA